MSASLLPFQSRFADVAGGRIHYLDEGTGPVLLLLHGNPTWSFLYHKLIVELSSHFRCIAPDYPGFGLSEATAGYGFTASEHAEALTGLLAQLDLRDVTLVAQDWGGPIGLHWATLHAERVRGLVLGNTWAWSLRGQPRYELFSWLMGGPIGRAASWLFNGVAEAFFYRGFHVRPTRAEFAAYRAPFRTRRSRAPVTVFPRQLIAAAPFLSAVESRLWVLRDKPALFLWGERDFAFRQPELARFEGLFPQHTTVRLPNASHFWQADAATEAASAIMRWEVFREPLTSSG